MLNEEANDFIVAACSGFYQGRTAALGSIFLWKCVQFRARFKKPPYFAQIPSRRRIGEIPLFVTPASGDGQGKCGNDGNTSKPEKSRN